MFLGYLTKEAQAHLFKSWVKEKYNMVLEVKKVRQVYELVWKSEWAMDENIKHTTKLAEIIEAMRFCSY